MATFLRMGEGKGWTMVTALMALSYPYFERLIWREFGPTIMTGDYDIVHRVTPLTPTAVSPIARKCAKAGVPFMIGPINGGVPWPKGFDAERRREKEWLSYVRGIYKLLPGRRKMLNATRAIIAGSRHTAGEIPKQFADRGVWLPENAIDLERFNLRSTQQMDGPLRACFIGRLVPYKGADMAILAAADFLAAGKMTLDIIGDGPMRAQLEALVQEQGLQEAVTFHGNLEHTKVQEVAAQTHVMTFPSVREFGGGVVLEAMVLGVVPIIVDYAGPGELVTDATGYKIPIGPREEIVTSMRAILEKLVEDRSDLPRKSAAATKLVQEHFTWPAKARQVREIYDWVLVGRDQRPDFTITSETGQP
jgi:glycosyltransferase involved in cell wall biosynthesis